MAFFRRASSIRTKGEHWNGHYDGGASAARGAVATRGDARLARIPRSEAAQPAGRPPAAPASYGALSLAAGEQERQLASRDYLDLQAASIQSALEEAHQQQRRLVTLNDKVFKKSELSKAGAV